MPAAKAAARWTGARGGQAFFAYSTNYLIDVANAVIVDGEAGPDDTGTPTKTGLRADRSSTSRAANLASRSALRDFFNTIGQKRTLRRSVVIARFSASAADQAGDLQISSPLLHWLGMRPRGRQWRITLSRAAARTLRKRKTIAQTKPSGKVG
jgi:hypothetical protein